MGDIEALLAIANVCQIVTVDDIKTLEDIKHRLAHTLSSSNPKHQVWPILSPLPLFPRTHTLCV